MRDDQLICVTGWQIIAEMVAQGIIVGAILM
jgi:hypothetical protein